MADDQAVGGVFDRGGIREGVVRGVIYDYSVSGDMINLAAEKLVVMRLPVQQESHPTPLGDVYRTELVVMGPRGEAHPGLRRIDDPDSTGVDKPRHAISTSIELIEPRVLPAEQYPGPAVGYGDIMIGDRTLDQDILRTIVETNPHWGTLDLVEDPHGGRRESVRGHTGQPYPRFLVVLEAVDVHHRPDGRPPRLSDNPDASRIILKH